MHVWVCMHVLCENGCVMRCTHIQENTYTMYIHIKIAANILGIPNQLHISSILLNI